MKGTKTGQGLRVNQVKYQIIKTVTDENSQCYSVSGKKVSCQLQWNIIYFYFSSCKLNVLAHIFVLSILVCDFSQTMGGCGLVLCGKCILIATFDETKMHTAPGCQAVLSDVAKHLRETLK